MKVFCITTGNIERVNSVNKQILFDFEFYYSLAVKDCVADIGFNPIKAKAWRAKGLNQQEVACFHSHLMLWEKCFKDNEPYFIFEDNIKVIRDIELPYVKACSRYGLVSFAQKITNESIIPHYNKMFYCRAYVITPESAFKLYQQATKEPIYIPVDSYMSEWIVTKVRGYCSPVPYFSRRGRNEIISLVGNDKPKMERFNKLDMLRPSFILIRIYRIILRRILTRYIV